MATTWEDCKQCVRTQGNLDFEAIDVAFIQPLKDLQAWWERQSAKTQGYIHFFSGVLVGDALKAFLKRVVSTEVVASFYEALGAAIVGIALGVAIDVMGRC